MLEHSWYPETTNYTYHGKLLTHMEVAYTDFDEVGHVDKLHFFYDAQSRPAKVRFNGTIYTYVHNLQGDIVGILDNNGNLVVEYKYDAWGKPLSTTGSLDDTLGIRNPFRYRGYVYDEETGLYYLQNRYYDAKMKRFVNADTFIWDGRHNLYSYTNNQVIVAYDISGKWTAAIGVSASVCIGPFSGSYSSGTCWDNQGNRGQFTTYGGLEFLGTEYYKKDGMQAITFSVADAGVAVFLQVTNKKTIEELEGWESSYGVSLPHGITVDILTDAGLSENKGDFMGVQLSWGSGISVGKIHIANQYTNVDVFSKLPWTVATRLALSRRGNGLYKVRISAGNVRSTVLYLN